jgi:hypothetical protein
MIEKIFIECDTGMPVPPGWMKDNIYRKRYGANKWIL